MSTMAERRASSSSTLAARASIRGSRLAPMGPRVRQSSTFSSPTEPETPLSRAGSLRSRDSRGSLSDQEASRVYENSLSPSPQTRPKSLPNAPDSGSPTRTRNDPPPQFTPSGSSSSTMNMITEEPGDFDPPPDFNAPSAPRPLSMAPPSFSASVAHTPPRVSPAPSKPSPPTVVTLPPAPKITWEAAPVQWKGLPLEAALCTVILEFFCFCSLLLTGTLDSDELQTIVSRAIRSSAQESIIRLLSVENYDTVLPAELERLDKAKTMAQAKYRFNVQRRTMLLQALTSFSSHGASSEKDGGSQLVGSLAVQLAEVANTW